MENPILSKIIYPIYDQALIKFAMPIIWKCKIADIENLYKKHITSNHLDIAAGTGYFIKNCKTLLPNSKLTIMDINPVCLKICKKMLKQFNPQIQEQDILKPIHSTTKYDSIGLNFVLHCLPGDMKAKEIVFHNIKQVLNPGGTVFGSTFIIKNAKLNPITWLWASFFNRVGVLNNREDTIEELQRILDHNFSKNKIEMIGHCALFWAKK